MTEQTHVRRDRLMVMLSLLIIRVTVGVIFVAHGAQKLFKAFGGSGITGLADRYGLVVAYLVAIAEFFGGIALIVGILSRFSAAALIGVMIGAIVLVHGPNGFFLSNRGYEYNLALIALLAPVLLAGPGRIALAALLPTRKRRGLMLLE